MATSAAFAGVGTLFQRADSSTSDFETISEINSITGPTMTRTTIDVTSLDSLLGYREYIDGFRDAGTVSLAMNFTDTGYRALLEDFESAIPCNYRILLPNDEATTINFLGLVTELPIDIKPDDKVTNNCTIRISGAVDLSSGS